MDQKPIVSTKKLFSAGFTVDQCLVVASKNLFTQSSKSHNHKRCLI